ncbi:hypothetical protein Acsp03_24850 [Actinomadura sp. NBRC 104412]|uniref:hypothetical protein n=1 Tax=Actinomadura sp. NBRC 104412 TaxID=3032203 RepID=UPI0024A56A5A|nr:hypothetical protein [Actinomadura sp. NBRC 104412]GLZ05019.1 hypothetical protein Acsp03_24850 [Actinomadura sp. NBRC 104412]
MIAALVLACLGGLLVLSLPLALPRRRRRSRERRSSRPADAKSSSPVPSAPSPADPGPYPESLTTELDPLDEEYLAFLANELWPEDEYLDMEPSIDQDNETEGGGGMCR